MWRDDPRPLNFVSKLLRRRANADDISYPNAAQRPKKRIAVSRQSNVSRLPWHRGVWDVPDGVPQDSWRNALCDDCFQVQARNLQFSDHFSLGSFCGGLTGFGDGRRRRP
jgi:hypothetical protein